MFTAIQTFIAGSQGWFIGRNLLLSIFANAVNSGAALRSQVMGWLWRRQFR
jgi:hypothetical protein